MSVVAAIGVIGGAYVLSNGFHPASKSTTDVLLPKDSYYSLPGNQYNAIDFITKATSRITGTFTNTLGVIVYILDPVQLMALNHNGTVGSYQWSSGLIANLTVDNLTVVVAPGQWALTFFNPNVLNTTIVGFYTPLILAPT